MTYPNHPSPMSMPGAAPAAPAGQQPPAGPAGGPPAAANPPAAPGPAAGNPANPANPPAPAAPPAPPPAPAAPVTPPWGSDAEFNPEKAWSLIQNLRGDKDTLQQQLTAATPVLQEHERLRQASLTDNERLNEQLAQEKSRGNTWRTAAVRSTAEALAATARFQDPADAIAMIGDLSGFIDGDAINIPSITERITKLATEKPYLLNAAGPQGFTPNPAQGQSGAGPANALDAQIKAAQDRGDFATSIALKQQQLLHKT